jgi:CP family cyanate transporter-like MFS transporter
VPRRTLAIAWLVGLAIFAPTFCVPPIEDVLKNQFLLTHTQTSLLFSAPIMMIVAASPAGGILADKIGLRKAVGIGIVVVLVGSILRGTADDASSLLIFTFIYGAGLGLSFPSLPKLVSAYVPRERSGLATVIFVAGIQSGAALALALTTRVFYLMYSSFQGVFLVWSVPSIIATGLWWSTLGRAVPVVDAERPIAGAANSLVAVLRNKNLWVLAVILLLHNIFFYAWAAWIPSLMLLKGASRPVAGLIGSVTLWAGIPANFAVPRLSSVLGSKRRLLWGPSIALALVAFGVIHANLPLAWPIMAIAGFALVARFTTALTLPVDMIPKDKVGTASGLLLSIGYIGGVLGPLIGGQALDLTGGLDAAFMILGVLSLVSVVLPFRLPETGTPQAAKVR